MLLAQRGRLLGKLDTIIAFVDGYASTRPDESAVRMRADFYRVVDEAREIVAAMTESQGEKA